MNVSLSYGQMQTPSEQDGIAALETVLKTVGYVSPTNVDASVKTVAITTFLGGKQNGKFGTR